MRGYRSETATRRHSATSPLCAALPTAVSLRGDESIEAKAAMFGNHQWKPNAVAEPPV